MKIVIIQPWIRQGGAESLTVNLASSLKRFGHQVKIVTLFTNFNELPLQARTLEYITPNKYLAQLCERSFLFRLMFGVPLLFLAAISSCKNVELINPHNFPSNWIAVIVSSLYRKPVVWTCNEPRIKITWERAKKVGIQEFFIGLLVPRRLERSLVRRIKGVIVLDEKNQKRIRAYYGRDSIIINPGVDFDFYQSASIENKRNIIKKYNLEKKFVLLVVGKLSPQKNQGLCIDCLKDIIPKIKNVVLVVVGSGLMRKELEQKVEQLRFKKHVRFPGFVSREELRDLYHVCNVNLFPATDQSWGMTPFEALCSKKISIVSTDCGASEVLDRRNIGVVSKPNPINFSENIVKIYDNSKYYQNIAQRGFNYVKENMSWKQYARKTCSVFFQAVNKK